ncbi:MAG: outer membrane immunogenic protein [Rhodobacteraceae bacterium HLUCCA12]|nr:MAG: outer membrane immunogenic protein [Rhodobacteraceae bacterium HLUCCA12]
MKRIPLILGALLLGTSTAMAGGPVVVEPEPEVHSPAPTTHNWTGGYAGLSLNYGRSSSATPPGFRLPNASGFGGGALAGYNWQNGNMVFGLEVAANLTRMNGTSNCANPAWTCRSRVNNVMSGRVRGGVAMDNTLLFVTAGVASASIRHSATSPANVTFPDTNRVNGLVVGVGIEHALAGGWNLRGDLEHYRFRRENYALDVPYPNVRTNMNMARISAVLRF